MKRRFLKVCIAVVSVLFLCVTNMKLNVFAEELTGTEDSSAGNGEAVEISDLYGIVDTEVPVVKGIELSKTEVEAPGTVEVIVDLYDEVSGVSYANIKFEDKETQKTVFCSLSKEYYDENNNRVEYEDGKWHGELQIDQYLPSGRYIVYSVYVSDNAGNNKYYYANTSSMGGNLLAENLWDLGFSVFNDDMGAIVTSGTTNPNLVDDIKNASEDAVIAIDYTQNSNLNKDVFDAIAGTDKKIALLSEGVQ